MCVKLLLENLNPGSSLLPPISQHPTSTYTCGVTIAPRVCDGKDFVYVSMHLFNKALVF